MIECGERVTGTAPLGSTDPSNREVPYSAYLRMPDPSASEVEA